MLRSINFTTALVPAVVWSITFVVWLVGDEPLSPIIVGPLILYAAVSSWAYLLGTLTEMWGRE